MAKKSSPVFFFVTFFFAIFLWGCQPVTSPAPATEPSVTIEPTDLPIQEDTPTTPAITINQPSPTPIESTDGLKRMVRLDAPAQRIVSMAPSNTESLFAIGAGDQVVGRDEFSDFPAEASGIPSVGGGFGDYNNEAIVDLQPDLVIAAEINTPAQVKALEDLGITVFYLANPTSLEEMYTNLATLGLLTGHEAEASNLIESLRTRVSAVEERLGEVSERPKVFYELDATDPNAPYTAAAGTFINTLINMAGGDNVASDLGDQYIPISTEELLLRNPEIILLGDAAYGINPEMVSARPGWEAIDAVKNQRIYTFDDNLVSRPGPRLVDGLEALAILLHPEVFQ
jgi:iron complex transport system substrate-binding protein